MLATAGHNEEEHGREELPADISWIVTTRESNNKRRKLQQRTKKREKKEGKRQRQTRARAREQVTNSSSSSSSSSSSDVSPGDTPDVPIILDGEEPVENPNRSPLGSTQLDVAEMASIMSTCSECGISKEFLRAMLKLVRPRLTKDDSLLEKNLNGEAVDRDAFMLRICFGAIEQHVEDESNSEDGAPNDFNLGAKLAGSFGSVLEK